MSSRVILIDDSEDDIRVASQAIQNVAPNAKLHVVRDGETALNVLTHTPVNARVILLDLNIPRVDGMRLLQELKSTKVESLPPIIIFSVSDNLETIQQARKNGATAYLVKPSEPEQLRTKVEETLRYWLKTMADTTPHDAFEALQ
jgi:CheY-like chemotaxis protein